LIGSKILSGRTKDQNVGYIAEYLTALGIDLKEVRVLGGEETAIVDALNALRRRCTYASLPAGSGPTHGDSPPTAWRRRLVPGIFAAGHVSLALTRFLMN
jgi:molybdopterin-biosynthesis enzyme MoeA-like protein